MKKTVVDMGLNKETCERMKGKWDLHGCRTTAPMVRSLVHDAGFEIDAYAKSYIDALDMAGEGYGEAGIRAQAFYIYENLYPADDKQKLALQQLLQIGRGKEVTFKLEKMPANEMTEMELSKISESFEQFSTKLQDQRYKAGFCAGITLKDFEDFATLYKYPVDKVLASNPWVTDEKGPLSREAVAAIKAAETRVKIKWS